MVFDKKYLGICFVCLFIPTFAFSLTGSQEAPLPVKGKNLFTNGYGYPGTLLAKGSASSKGSSRGGKMLMQEKSIKTKKGDSKSLNFEETSIGGERKTPLGSFISQTKSDKNFGFVKIRTNWHPEMIQSATMIEGQR